MFARGQKQCRQGIHGSLNNSARMLQRCSDGALSMLHLFARHGSTNARRILSNRLQEPELEMYPCLEIFNISSRTRKNTICRGCVTLEI